MAGLVPAWGQVQEDDYLVGDVPEWLEGYGYEDTHDDIPGTEDATEPIEEDSGIAAPGNEASSSGQCDCFRCREINGRLVRIPVVSAAKGNRLPWKSHPVLLRCRGWCQSASSPFRSPTLGIAGGDTFEYTGNSHHDFLVDLDKFGGLPPAEFVVTMENVWGRWGNVSFKRVASHQPSSMPPCRLIRWHTETFTARISC